MLKAQHPLVGGFQDIALAQKLAMTPEPGEFIQLLNVGSQHWITVSNIGCNTPFSVKVYDSMHWRLTGHEKKVVADLRTSVPRKSYNGVIYGCPTLSRWE